MGSPVAPGERPAMSICFNGGRESPAPPPDDAVVHAYLHLLRQALRYLRNHGARLPAQQLADLGDALHNVPEFIEHGVWTEPQFRRLYLAPYDQLWARDGQSPSLIAWVEAGLAAARDA